MRESGPTYFRAVSITAEQCRTDRFYPGCKAPPDARIKKWQILSKALMFFDMVRRFLLFYTAEQTGCEDDNQANDDSHPAAAFFISETR
ncbi:hypothetical protein [Noviherbaspirillum malthae]|uniref:hypothetical protein n=1 Tax=Noviherbaspirillum malthae TaxID=1260987 RepID=UPI001890B037|nr:hypothetical protein [Noviherbaspirillum malthae]